MEDQPASPSGLTPEDAPKPRRAHRMPVGKARRRTVDEAEVDGAAATESPAAEVDQPDAEGLGAATDTGTATDTDTDVAVVATDSPVDEPETVDSEADSEIDSGVVEAPVVFAERKPVGKWLKVGVVAMAVALVAAAGFAGATVQPYLADRALTEIKLDVTSTAASAITTLWTYTPEDMEALPDRASQFLSNDFEDAYRQYVDGIAATNKQAQVSNDTQVLGAAVESIGPSQATALVYTNSTATSPLTKDIPSLRYVSYRLTLERPGATWLVSSMSTITSLDLTPQL